MQINFDTLLNDNDSIVLNPRDIFLTLDRKEKFAFLRDIQTEVMKDWFEKRKEQDTIIKLNVGSGKTLVGLLILQSSLNEEVSPAAYFAANKQLVDQVIEEAKDLNIEITSDPQDPSFRSGDRILVTTVHRLFNGKSVFGVSTDGVKIPLGVVVIDDAHACIETITEQFRISLPNTHSAYKKIFNIFERDLERQNHARFLDLKSGDSGAMIEVPYWVWIDAKEKVLQALHAQKDDDHLKFTYPLLRDVLELCRCIIGGQRLEIEPDCPPTDLIMAFSRAQRRIYMTAMLADDSVLVTHLGADPNKLSNPIVPTSTQSIGERMILMPQELNPEITLDEVKKLLVKLEKENNVVVIVPSKNAADDWSDVAKQILLAENVAEGVDGLRKDRVGLTVFINKYDGIDLPHEACRVLVIYNLPEVASFSDLTDMAIISDSQIGLRRQMQRIEQGMGRGIRSNDDYCVVLLVGSKLTYRVKSKEGIKLLTPATQAQLELSREIAGQLGGVDIDGIAGVIDQCLKRDTSWVKVNKRALLNAHAKKGLILDSSRVAIKRAFIFARNDEYKDAAQLLNTAAKVSQDDDEKAWLMSKLAAIQHRLDPVESQKTLLKARRKNMNVLRPMEGIAYQQLEIRNGEQAASAQSYHSKNFLEFTERMMHVNKFTNDLRFQSVSPDDFEDAIDDVALFIGLNSQRPEKEFNEGPDNLWMLPDTSFIIIECKNNVTSTNGISKTHLGQLNQSMSWFSSKYKSIASATPVIIHPLRNLGDGASEVEGMRIITEIELSKLRKALFKFAKSLSDPSILNNLKKIHGLLAFHGFNGKEFLTRYTSEPK